MKWISRVIQTIFIIICALTYLYFVFQPTTAWGGGRTYNEKEKDTLIINCHLAARKVIKKQKICLYRGANNTEENVFINKFEHCPKTIKCIYEPNKKAPMVQEALESIERALSK